MTNLLRRPLPSWRRAARAVSGPLVTILAIAATEAVRATAYDINSLAPALLAVVFAAYVGGRVGGYVSAAFLALYAFHYLSPAGMLLPVDESLVRALMSALTAFAIVALVTALRAANARGVARAEEAHAAAHEREHSHAIEMEQKNRELEAKNETLEAFSYTVAHDLRAPLRGMTILLDETLRTEAALSAGGRETLLVANQTAQNMDRLVESLLRFSRASGGVLETARVDACALTREVAGEIGRRYPGHAVTFSCTASGDVLADPHLLRVALENVLDNAWKYSQGVDEARVWVTYERDADGNALIVVRDNGAGFDAAAATRLFTPFERLHKVAPFPGHGIGLATVHRILTRHGGKIRAEGAVGAGAAFHLTLPAPPLAVNLNGEASSGADVRATER